MIWTPTYIKYPGNIWGDMPEPPEEGADVVFVEASNKRAALVKGVRALRKMGSDWILDQQSDGASPFTGLHAQKAECEHGFCWCELPDCIQPNPEWIFEDICPVCEENDKQNCVHEMYTGPAQLSGQKQSRIQEYCNLCLQSREEINARSNQRFSTGSTNNI